MFLSEEKVPTSVSHPEIKPRTDGPQRVVVQILLSPSRLFLCSTGLEAVKAMPFGCCAALTAPRLRTEPESGDAEERLRRGSGKKADCGKTACCMFSSCTSQAALCSSASNGFPERRTPKATCTSLRIMAQIITFGAFPFAESRALNARPHPVLFTATIAGI